jgi:hypothetical protein
MGPAGLAAHIPRGTNHVGASRCGNTSAVMERARWIVGTIGVPTLGAGIVATFMHEPAVADAAMIFTGGGMTIIAAPRPLAISDYDNYWAILACQQTNGSDLRLFWPLGGTNG